MSTPSIALIPSGYKSGKLYSQLPVNGDGDLTFARVGNATRVNENGLIEEMATGVPRLDYSDGGCPSLLVEPSSTNLVEYSEDFSDVSWGSVQSSILSGFMSPFGALNATKLIDTAVDTEHRIGVTIPVTSGQNYTFSTFVKKSELDWFRLGVFGVANTRVWFDLSNGVVGTAQSLVLNPFIEDYGNDWFRVGFSYLATSTTSITPSLFLSKQDNQSSYLGDGLSGVFIFGTQFENLSYATSYIPNNGNAAGETRDAETVSKSGLSDYINSSEGVFYVEMAALTDESVNRYISLSDNSDSNRIVLRFPNATQQIGCFVQLNGGNVVSIVETNVNVLDFNKVCVRYTEDDYTLFLNGAKISTVSAQDLASNPLDTLKFSSGSGSFPFKGKVKDLRVYKTVLTDTELQTLTS